MSVRVTCPACGAELTLDAMLSHDAARRAVAAAMQISAPLADRLMKYLALFRPASRQLTMDRIATLLAELLPMLQAMRVKRGGREYATIIDDWKAALDQVLANRDAGTLKLPLKSHGYLLEVLCAMCERHERAIEEQREQSRRNPHRDLTAEQADTQRVSTLVAQSDPQRLAEMAARGPRQVPAESLAVLKTLGFRTRGRGDPA